MIGVIKPAIFEASVTRLLRPELLHFYTCKSSSCKLDVAASIFAKISIGS